MTLPLIYALNKATNSEKRRIINLVKNESHKASKVKEVIDFVKQSGGIEHTEQVMKQFQQEAFEILAKFEDSQSKTSLEQLVNYTVEREK